jgi:hypothetical protein
MANDQVRMTNDQARMTNDQAQMTNDRSSTPAGLPGMVNEADS